jgi:hypothetical protein
MTEMTTVPATGGHVQYEAIERAEGELSGPALMHLNRIKEGVGTIEVGFPGFGVIGGTLSGSHSATKRASQEQLEKSAAKLTQFSERLKQTIKQWQAADDASTIEEVRR